ncbi:Cell division protein FtsH (plasmid) [Rhodovastum atsumiense]|uniref:AAA family ATPase n=1 Tax=Rhodovastum atsumiense TaxID=504468 RepID=A0A5M6IUB2_9PROT|nr:AAA family ATPase [Rhodovastum atsumiense]KAA5611862.1 AAA family ATPase [Rhodovastum atsumiense]CAH2606160.1 Cell division protein FtsH [Rhodovastum atsumiense]
MPSDEDDVEDVDIATIEAQIAADLRLPPDPARLLVDALTAAAIERAPDWANASIVVVRSPSDEWTSALADVVETKACAIPSVGVCKVLKRPDRFGSDRARVSPSEHTDAINNAMRLGNKDGMLVLVSARLDTDFPSVLLRAAQATLDCSEITSAVVASVVAKMTSGDAAGVPDDVARHLTPVVMRLAWRPSMASADYVRRLGELVERPKHARSEWTLARLHGCDEAVAWGNSTCRDIADCQAGRLAWKDMDRGALLCGPPGCGKTTFAAALAASAGVPLIPASYSKWKSGEDGKGSYTEIIGRMRQDFALARSQAPCILFIDEIDSLIGRGQAGHNESWFAPLTNALLAEMDGLASREGVIVLAASNFPERVDPALRRAGRLDRVLRLGLPDAPALERILQEHLGADADGLDLSQAARLALGGSGADCERWSRGARRRARHAGRRLVLADLIAEIRDNEGGKRSPEILRRAAVHEAGHAVVMMQHGRRVWHVGIRATGTMAGAIESDAPRMATTAADVRAVLVDLMAGRAAEEVLLGEPGGGAGGSASSDLSQATVIAASAEAAWGLGGRLTWIADPTAENVGSLLGLNRALAERVEARLADAYAAAIDVVRRRRAEVEAVAEALAVREVLTGDELRAVVAGAAGNACVPKEVLQ